MTDFIIIYLLLGAITGILSGLLGIGGGIVVVPALAFIFRYQHIPDQVLMHVAVGTSLAVMIFTTARSLISHLSYKNNDEFWRLAKLFAPSIIVGVMCGAILADFLHSVILRVTFGVFVLLVAGRLLFYRSKQADRVLPTHPVIRTVALFMGALSGLLGVGGGTTTVPYLLYYQVSMRLAVRLSIFVGVLIAIVGTIIYALSGLDETLPAHCWGYIYWPAWLAIAVGSVLCAPIGVRLSYKTPTVILKRIFAVLMLFIGFHMLFS